VTAAVAVSGWLCAGAALAAVAWLRLRLDRCASLVAQAAHELRGPLFAAQLGVDLVARSRPQEARRLAAVGLELRRAALAVGDLAGAPAGRREAATRELLDVGAVVEDLAPSWAALTEAHGATLTVATPRGALIRGDVLRLTQALGNLVSNAAEHGGGEVSVRVSAPKGCVRVEVSDDGPGLPAPVASLASAARGRTTARGHGIAIAARIAREHGGRLAAAPSERGARLVLELPAATQPAAGLARDRRAR
jgi:signal transduction histidine kinase